MNLQLLKKVSRHPFPSYGKRPCFCDVEVYADKNSCLHIFLFDCASNNGPSLVNSFERIATQVLCILRGTTSFPIGPENVLWYERDAESKDPLSRVEMSWSLDREHFVDPKWFPAEDPRKIL